MPKMSPSLTMICTKQLSANHSFFLPIKVRHCLRKIWICFSKSSSYLNFLSTLAAHALHPNYSSKHEKNHQPQMNAGMVIKRNANQRYATNGVTGVLIREVARRASLPPVQEFIVRQDCGCGSTIGPLLSTATGIRAIDMGCPQLSMHSIRETMGVCDCKFTASLL